VLAGKRLAVFFVALAPFALAGIIALVIFGKSATSPIARPLRGPIGGPPGPRGPGAPPVPRVGAPVEVGTLFRPSNVAAAKAALARRAGPRARLVHAIITETAAIFGVARGGALLNYLWVLNSRDFLGTPTPAAGAAAGQKTLSLTSLDARAPGRIAGAIRRLTHDPRVSFDGMNLSRRPDTGALYWGVSVRTRGRPRVFAAAPNGTHVRRIA
jgi:hypothetical protein